MEMIQLVDEGLGQGGNNHATVLLIGFLDQPVRMDIWINLTE
jgi:hypothetical protein